MVLSGEPEPFEVAADLAQSARAVRRDLDQLRRSVSAALPVAGAIAAWSRGLPRLRVPLSDGLAGDTVLEGLTLRQPWPLRYRAVAVIELPEMFEQYLRGRSRQAVRTNRAHASARGLTVVRAASRSEAQAFVDEMLAQHTFELTVDEVLVRLAAEENRQIWFVLDRQCVPVGMAAVAVDREIAQLAWLQIAGDVEHRSDARYLLSTEIVRGLIAESRKYLVADSMLLSRPGVVYLQRRLGFEPMRLVVPRRARWRRAVRGLRRRPVPPAPAPCIPPVGVAPESRPLLRSAHAGSA